MMKMSMTSLCSACHSCNTAGHGRYETVHDFVRAIDYVPVRGANPFRLVPQGSLKI
ncbi:exported hypothetical protein [Candidatus Contendobacter odensis Run_B_J11]|uniref:Uncharacterized protein n=1 Tax=Candidatus Contendobacter odensis Run_B_J11 TaxID=1400861 RepID=A0A7U7J1N6_9GAMM|nr:exported hypothetical protein [Candidatus Contendobacter odensis Run_B_J11]